MSREEFAHAEDLGGYYKIKADNRDLNYNKFFEEGDSKVDQMEEYHSHNTKQLNHEELKKVLLDLDYIQEQIKA